MSLESPAIEHVSLLDSLWYSTGELFTQYSPIDIPMKLFLEKQIYEMDCTFPCYSIMNPEGCCKQDPEVQGYTFDSVSMTVYY